MSLSGINNQTATLEQTKTSLNIAEMKKESDKKIVEAQLEVSLKDGPSVMSLLFRTAIEEINKQMPGTGSGTGTGTENTIEKAYENNLDISPEATAKRIVTGATAFFNAYKEQNSELNESEALNQFMSVISEGINTGFGDAREILGNLSVLEGEIESDIELTYDLVQSGLEEYTQKIMAVIAEEIPKITPEEPVKTE